MTGVRTQSHHSPPAVLVHGVGLDCTMWDGVGAFIGKEVACQSVDMPGHGKSSRLAPSELSGYVSALADDTAHMDPFILVGFSMGAMVAAGFAATYPSKVAGLVMMNAVHRRSPAQRAAITDRLSMASTQGLASIADAAVLRWFTDAFARSQPGKVQAVRDRLIKNDLGAYLAAYRVFATSDAEVADLLPHIQCPVLAVTAENDVNSTPAMSSAIAADVVNGRVHTWKNLAHGAPIEAPKLVADTLMSFAKEVGR